MYIWFNWLNQWLTGWTNNPLTLYLDWVKHWVEFNNTGGGWKLCQGGGSFTRSSQIYSEWLTGPIFVSNFWKELFKLHGTHLTMSSACHPETDGQTEVINRCLETYLRCFIADQTRTWIQWLHWPEYWSNTTFREFTRVTLFHIVYGREPPTLFWFTNGETKVEAVQ